MPKSSRSFLFPDINVWIALTYRGHIHHGRARAWLDSVADDRSLCFCRITQLGFLRLLTTTAVMGTRVLTQVSAWEVYDNWIENGRAMFIEEPPSIERTFRATSKSQQSAPKDWADSYLCAFAQASELRLVTFDHALHERTSGSLLLRA